MARSSADRQDRQRRHRKWLWSAGPPDPAYDFLHAEMPQGATLTRASTGWRFNSAGLIVPALTDVARFTYSPATLALEGLLVEPARTNLCLRSEALDNVAWSVVRCTVTADAAAAPDGNITADAIVEDTSNSTHFPASTAIALTNQNYSISVFAKSWTREGVQWRLDGGAGTIGVNLNFSTGATSIVTGLTLSIGSMTINNGWYRSYAVGTWPNSSNGQAEPLPAHPASTVSYQGVLANGIYAWGAMVEAGSSPSSYIPTAGSAVTRAADILTLAAPSGTYAVDIERLSGVTSLSGQTITTGVYTVPTSVSPLRRVTFRRTG